MASSVSRSSRPSSERNVVCAICEVATAWFSTSMTDLIGSITRNRTTVFTRASLDGPFGTVQRLKMCQLILDRSGTGVSGMSLRPVGPI